MELVAATPCLEPSFYSTPFYVCDFQTEVQELTAQLVSATSDKADWCGIESSLLRFQSLLELEAHAVKLGHTTSAPQLLIEGPASPSAQEVIDKQAIEGAAVVPTASRKRPRLDDRNRPGLPYQAPEHAAAATEARRSELEHVRSSWQGRLSAAAQVLRTVNQAAAASQRGVKDINHRSHTDQQAVPGRTAIAGMSSRLSASEQLDQDEVILTLAIYKPEGSASRHSQDIAVLGSQAVEVVRDALRCDNDVHLSALNMAQPSSCLYLEGVFYLDCRDANAMDISKPVRDFLASKHVMAPRQPHRGACEGVWGGWEDLSPAETGFGVRRMDEVTFSQLGLRAGAAAGYSLCHQGCCEHQVAVTDVRKVHCLDPQHRSAYPLMLVQAHVNKRNCSICGDKRAASKVTYNDVTALESPAFWCRPCYEMLHYTSQGSLLDNEHKVFEYTAG